MSCWNDQPLQTPYDWRYCAHDRVLGICGISRGPKSLRLMSMSSWEHTKCGWAYFGHLHTICTPSARHPRNKRVSLLLSIWHLRNWAKHQKLCQLSYHVSLKKNCQWSRMSSTRCLSSKAIQFARPCSALACAITSALMRWMSSWSWGAKRLGPVIPTISNNLFNQISVKKKSATQNNGVLLITSDYNKRNKFCLFFRVLNFCHPKFAGESPFLAKSPS